VDPEARREAETSAELFDFLSVFLRDLERSEVRELDSYLARFPGCEDEVRKEYEARTGVAPATAPAEVREVGPYRVLGELGRGGQGVVYLAEDSRIARRVALKLLPASSLLFSEAKRGRLQREAEVVSRLDHPGICGLYDAEISGDFAYLAMPVIEGQTLASALSEAKEGRQPRERWVLPLAPESREELHRLLAFFEEAARALHAAHQAGVVHRDVKPGNLMVTPDGRGVWLDFGLALDTESAGRVLTMSGEVFGTPAYMSPEQVTDAAQKIDARTDVWALGVSLFEALTLERPFHAASTHAILFAVQESAPRALGDLRPDLPRDVDVVLRTALEKDLGRRYASALHFAEELARIRRSEPILARPAGPLLRLWRWARRSPLVFGSVAGAILVLSVALVWTLMLLAREEQALDFALGRHLGERAVALLEEDPSASMVLAIEAVEKAPSYLTRSALYAAMDRCHVARELDGYVGYRFRDIAVMDDGEHVAAVFEDGSARVYEITTGEEVLSWQPHEGAALFVAAKGAWVASIGADRKIQVFDTEERVDVATLDGPDYEPAGLTLTRSGPGVERASVGVSRGPSSGVESWALASGEHLGVEHPEDPEGWAELESLPLRVAQGEVVHASRSPDGTRWAVAMESGVVDVFDGRARRRVAELEGYLKPAKVLWTLDGEFLVTHSKGPTARIWFAENRPDMYRLRCDDAPLQRVLFTPQGRHALCLLSDGAWMVWAAPAEPGTNPGAGTFLGALEREGEELRPYALRDGVSEMELERIAAEAGLDTGDQGGSLPGLEHEALSTRHSLDGEWTAVVDAEGGLSCWKKATGERVWEMALQEKSGDRVEAVDLAFAPSGEELTVVAEDGLVRFLGTETGEPTRDLIRSITPRTVRWSPDGERLLIIGLEGRAAFHVQHLATGERMYTEVFHHGDITSGAFSPDGGLVLTSSTDGTIFVRDVRDGSPIAHLQGDGAPILDAAFSSGPGPLRVIGGFADGTAQVWPVDPLPAAKARKPRELAAWEVAREQRLALPLEYR